MEFFFIRSDGVYLFIKGMTQLAIEEMLTAQGLSCTFISENAYNAYVAENQRPL